VKKSYVCSFFTYILIIRLDPEASQIKHKKDYEPKFTSLNVQIKPETAQKVQFGHFMFSRIMKCYKYVLISNKRQI